MNSSLCEIGDAATEARVVAWVLGEASAFEAEELQRLCAEFPEWKVFHRRMLAMHQLLSEPTQPANSWKLPPEKRAALEALFPADPQKTEEIREKRVRRSARRVWLSLAACLAISAVLWVFLNAPRRSWLPAATQERLRGDIDIIGGSHFSLKLPSRGSVVAHENQPMPEISTLNADGGDRLEGERAEGRVWKTESAAGGGFAADPFAAPASEPASNPAALRPSAAPAPVASAAPAGGKQNELKIAQSESKLSSQTKRDKRQIASSELGNDELRQIPAKRKNSVLVEESQKPLSRRLERDDSVKDKAADADATIAFPEGANMVFPAEAEPPTVLNESAEVSKKLALSTEETSAADSPFSTFSLNVSDASFQTAKAALDRGERPDPASIQPEHFYNAVDYGDPSPAVGQAVAMHIEQAAHPFIPGRNLVRIALKTATTGRSAAQPLRLTLLVDQSGSMVREDRRLAMEQVFSGLAEVLTANDLVTVIGFSRTPRLLADRLPGDQAGNLPNLLNTTANEGGTHLEAAIQLAGELATAQRLDGAQNRIVLFTDGAANLGDADPTHLSEKIEALRQTGIAFDVAGIAANDLNDALLGELARHGNGRYFVVGEANDVPLAAKLAGAFRPAAENVKVQVRFNPERVATYRLIGFEKDRLRAEDFHNDAVDAAELACGEAGVAVYQIEPIPDGHGEIGEVGVRFRDTAADRMVEHTWTIPHQPSAPTLDRATPSMQLAALATCVAEKFRGGPLAEAIEFPKLANIRAKVKQHYGKDPKVLDLLRMMAP